MPTPIKKELNSLFPGLTLNYAFVMQDNVFDSLQSTIAGSVKNKNNGAPNYYEGTDSDDELNGRGKDDLITGGLGNDFIRGQGGRDVLQGGAGSDTVLGQGGDDFLIYSFSENLNSESDYYDGGGDSQGEEDSIWFMLTYGEYKAYGTEIEAYQLALNDNNRAHGFYNEFSFNLIVDDIESAEIIRTNRGPTANADTFTTDEDSTYTTADVRNNDTDPDNLDELKVINLNTLGTIGTVTANFTNGTFFYNPNNQFEYLADSESTTDSFDYTISDLAGVESTTTVTMVITGVNDQPIAQDVSASVGEDDAGVNGSFVGTDVDATDILSFSIISEPIDALGHQYGGVSNNNDGTFTFNPLNDFQFLELGESRDVTFQYVAIDDSGVAANNTSDFKAVTVTVNGAYDAPIVIEENVLFESSGQSMWETGDAFTIDWREFYGAEWDESFSETIVNSASLQIVPVVDLRVAGIGPYYGGLSVTSPAVSIGGSTTGRFGISPYFEFDSGSVDSNIPVDIDLTYEVQYEGGDSISILTGYSVDNAAYFETTSPQITFGIDLVFEFTAEGDLTIGSSSFGGGGSYSLFPNINIDIDEPELPGTDINLIEFSSETGVSSDVFDTSSLSGWLDQDGEGGYIISHPDYDTNLALSFPTIDTTGALTEPNRLESTGSDDFAVLDIDLDEIVSEATKYVPPMHYEGSEGLNFEFDLPGFVNTFGIDDVDIDLFSVTWDFELIDIDLISTLTAVQDFTLDIEDLLLMVTLENGDIINGFKMGDNIEFDLPDWDVDLLGDQDGIMDYSLAIDMDAMLNNWTTLDFNLELLARALKANIGYTSDIVGDNSYSLFGSDNDGFLVAESFNLLNVSPLATLFGDEDPSVSGFDLEGFNKVTYEDGFLIA